MTKQPFRFILFLLICVLIPLTATAQTVNIPDPNLGAEIARALGKSWGDPITAADMAKLTHLDARNANISDLTGLEHATKLTRLNLGRGYVESEARWINSNSVSNLSPLEGLTSLTELWLEANNISDISPLAELTKLTWLRIDSNNISDISPVVGLTKLTYLHLAGNSISNISAVTGLTDLTELWLADNTTISDISPLAGLIKLTGLGLGYNAITDHSILSELTKLTQLDLRGTNISDLSVLSGLTKLERLYIDNNGISDLSPLAVLTSLTTLGLDINSISNLSPLSGLTNLAWMRLADNDISDISPLEDNMGLGEGDWIDLRDNPLNHASIETRIPALQGRGVTVEFDNRTPPTLLKISGTVTPSDNVLIVEVRGNDNRPFAGVPVTFTVTSGGGTLSVTSTTADENGRAQTTLTLGSTGEPNNVEASVAGVVQTVTFSDVPEPTVNILDPNLRAAVVEALDKAPDTSITAAEIQVLTRLNVYEAGISDLTGLEFATSLESLSLWNNNITDLSPLAELNHLTSLSLGGNNITDISPLSDLTNLRSLRLSDNGITDVSALVAVLSNLTNLTSLGLGRNNIADISPLSSLTHLTALFLDGAGITDVSTIAALLSSLPNLTSLNLSNNNITDVPGLLAMLSRLTNLRGLQLGGTGITDISPLSSLTNLEGLFLWNNNITDISPLTGLTNLTQLVLDRNNITDISPLAGLTNLRWFLHLSNNRISDLSPLVENAGIGSGFQVYVRGNPLSYPSLRTHIPTLQGRGVNVQSEDRTPNTLQKISGDQHGAPAAVLTKPFVVEVQDERRRAFAGVPVTFTVTAGGGTLSVTNTETGPDGRAESTLTLGSGTGANTVSVSAAGIQQTVTFNAVGREGVLIPDSKLRTAIGIALNKSFGETIVASDMAALTSLEAEEAGISDLTGLELATDLTELRLARNNISDISVVKELTNLTRLHLGENNISEISAVAGLTNLTVVGLWSNAISDISPLSDLTNLRELWLWSNAISDISPVRELTNLTELSFGGNNISDISPVSGLTNLTRLWLDRNAISDISVVKGLTNLTWLDLQDNTISDISIVKGLPHLTRLDLDNNSVSDISAVAGLTNLTRLHLDNNSVSDISAVTRLTSLTELHLDNNSVSDISAVTRLTSLTELHLNSNSVSDISAVAGLTKLTELRFGGNAISDLSVVSGLTSLTRLDLWGNDVSDISAVADLTNLTRLNLEGNSIWDLSPLVENTGIGSGDEVYLWGNPLSYPSIHTHLPTLRGRGVQGLFFEERNPTTLRIISGNNQSGISGETLANPFIVEVQDERRRAFAGIEVTFAVTAGGGTLSVTSATTDGNGRAQTTLTLGSDTGMNTVSVSAAGIEQTVTFNALVESIEFDLSVPADISLIHVPLKVIAVDGVAKTITSIADLYDALGGADTVNYLITYDTQAQKWLSYFSTLDKGTDADKGLTDDTGIIAGMKTPVSLRLTGNPLGTDGTSTITLNPKLNLVGVPLKDSRINRVSDLFSLEGIGSNVSVIIVSDNGKFKAVGQSGDDGDSPITGGQSFILNAQEAATVAISGDGWTNAPGTAAAPLVGNADAVPSILASRDLHSLTGIQVTDTTPVLALRGAIVDEGTWTNRASFRVTVKNLSTRNTITGMIGDEGNGYRLTVVDIEKGRAAMIGDILEVSVQSSNPLIGVEPLRYTVTADDVKRSLIQLPELVTYEIPAETELLRNYPNPFNPETWIPYRLAEDAFVTLTIYDTMGRVVRTLEIGHQVAAVYESRSKAAYWDGRNALGEQVASGVYFYHLSAGDHSATRRMVILK